MATTVSVTVEPASATEITVTISPGIGYLVPIGGTTGQVLTGVTGGAPVWGSVAGTGDVVGPVSSVDGRLAVFNGATGKLIAQAGITITELLLRLPASGVGSPEGVVARYPGVPYIDEATGDKWEKTSGTGTTGWVKYIEI